MESHFYLMDVRSDHRSASILGVVGAFRVYDHWLTGLSGQLDEAFGQSG
jgi:ABC-type phosphate/phosphonate transport system permease subunit